MLDLLSRLVSDLRLQVRDARTHTWVGDWAFLVPQGPATLHLVRCGSCLAWSAASPWALPIGCGAALLLSGALECSFQGCGPRRTPSSDFEPQAGSPVEEMVFRPDDPSGVQLLSARVEVSGGSRHRAPLPPVVVLRADSLFLREWRVPILESLRYELSHPRLGARANVERLLEVLVIQGLRAELGAGAWRAQGLLRALTDPVLRTGLMDVEAEGALCSAGALASIVHRSPRRVRARVKAFSGASPGRLLREVRMERALNRLEAGRPRLQDLARELGYSGVSAFCRAFRREIGCTPAAYWRRATGRPFPKDRRGRRPGPLGD